MGIVAERVFNVFDATRAGLVVSLATATLGPLIEVRQPDLTTMFQPHKDRQDERSIVLPTFVRLVCASAFWTPVV